MNKLSTFHRARNGRPQEQQVVTIFTRRPAGPLNYLTKFAERQEVGLVPAFKAGEVWSLQVHHEPGCPLLSGVASCLCDPDISFQRLAAGGLGPAAMATAHGEREAAR